MKLTVPVEAVNVPFVPLMKVPPAFKIPASENVILEPVLADVILPETVAVPVDIRICVTLVPEDPCRAMDNAEKVPESTLIVLVLPFAGRGMVTAPLAVRDDVLVARTMEADALPLVKLIVVHRAAYPSGTVTVMPPLMVTESAAPGTDEPPQVFVLFQSPDTLAVLGAACTVFVVRTAIAKIANEVQSILTGKEGAGRAVCAEENPSLMADFKIPRLNGIIYSSLSCVL